MKNKVLIFDFFLIYYIKNFGLNINENKVLIFDFFF
jgi:hypothetical protein